MHSLPRLAVACFGVAGVVGFAVPVHAAEPTTTPALGDTGQFILSGERLFGVNYTTYKDNNTTLSNFRVSAFWSQPLEFDALPNPATIPRLAGDFVVAPNVTVGAAVGAAYSAFSAEGRSTLKNFSLLASPRVGYAIALGGTARLWLRGGVSYFRANIEERDENMTWSQISVTVEPMFVLPLASNFAFTIAPVADIPMSGKIAEDNRSDSVRTTTFGVNAGLLGYF